MWGAVDAVTRIFGWLLFADADCTRSIHPKLQGVQDITAPLLDPQKLAMRLTIHRSCLCPPLRLPPPSCMGASRPCRAQHSTAQHTKDGTMFTTCLLMQHTELVCAASSYVRDAVNPSGRNSFVPCHAVTPPPKHTHMSPWHPLPPSYRLTPMLLTMPSSPACLSAPQIAPPPPTRINIPPHGALPAPLPCRDMTHPHAADHAVQSCLPQCAPYGCVPPCTAKGVKVAPEAATEHYRILGD
jgi:hypothetical protein